MRTHSLHSSSHFYPARVQRGIVLALVLVMIGIMSLIGALSLRNATLTEQTTNSMRTAATAQQAAELAAKFCELVAADSAQTTPGATFATERAQIGSTITAAISTGIWNSVTTWTGSAPANVIKVPVSYLASTTANTATTALKNRPQCIIEPIADSAGVGFVITARGFGNDAVLNTTNGVTSGAEAWVQSVLRP